MPVQSQEQDTLNVKLVHFTKQNSPAERQARAAFKEHKCGEKKKLPPRVARRTEK